MKYSLKNLLLIVALLTVIVCCIADWSRFQNRKRTQILMEELMTDIAYFGDADVYDVYICNPTEIELDPENTNKQFFAVLYVARCWHAYESTPSQFEKQKAVSSCNHLLRFLNCWTPSDFHRIADYTMLRFERTDEKKIQSSFDDFLTLSINQNF